MDNKERKRYFIVDENSPIERIMQVELDRHGFRYASQYPVYESGSAMARYILGFLVYGDRCKIVVECDGSSFHSSSREQRERDMYRDAWLRDHGLAAVLRFSRRQITKNVGQCIEEISKCVRAIDKGERYEQPEPAVSHRVVPTARFDLDKKIVRLYCAGVANSRVWGWGAASVVLTHGRHTKVICESHINTNTNRMQLRAIILGLRAVKQTCNIEVFVDSMYVVNQGNRTYTYRHEVSRPNIPEPDLWLTIRKLIGEHIVIFKPRSSESDRQLRRAKQSAGKSSKKGPEASRVDLPFKMAPELTDIEL